MNKTILLAALAVCGATPAFAADAAGETVVTEEAVQSAIDIAFGVTVTSDYISRGTTQTDGDPAIQGYIELGYNIFYVGAWASNVKFDGVSDVEIDVGGGFRPEFGNLSLDFGFVQYFYTKDSTNYGDAYALASYAFTDWFSAGAEVWYEVYAETVWANVNAEVSGLPWDTVVSGALGSDFGSLELGSDKVDWNIGIAKTFGDYVTIDLRYHDSNYDPARFVASLSFDTSWSALRAATGQDF